MAVFHFVLVTEEELDLDLKALETIEQVEGEFRDQGTVTGTVLSPGPARQHTIKLARDAWLYYHRLWNEDVRALYGDREDDAALHD